MNGIVNTALNKMEITEKEDYIEFKGTVFGFNTHTVLYRILGKSKYKLIFRNVSINNLQVYKFFIPDFIETIREAKSDGLRHFVRADNIDYVLDWFEERKKQRMKEAEIDYSRISKEMSFNIMEHQKKIFERYEYFITELDYKGMLIDAAPGTGKTFSSLALSTGLKSDVTIIICPLPTIEKVWIKSLDKSSGECVFKETQKYINISTDKYKDEKFILCHYESLSKLKDLVKTLNNKSVTIIIDESHNLNDMKSIRTKTAIEIIRDIKPNHTFLLSGTPLKSSYMEMIPILYMIDPDFNQNLEKRFREFYNRPNEFVRTLLTKRYGAISVKVVKDSMKLDPVINEDIVVKLPKNIADTYTLPYIKEQIKKYCTERLDYIKKNYANFLREYGRLRDMAFENSKGMISKQEFEEYKAKFNRICNMSPGVLMQSSKLLNEVNIFEEKLASLLQGDDKKMFKDFKTIVKYPALKVQGEALGKIVTGSRIRCHRDMAEYLDFKRIIDNSAKKTIVFSNYVEVCDSCISKLKRLGYKPVSVYGEQVKYLNQNVNKFTKGKENPLVASYKSLSTGVPLIVANTIICIDLPFRIATYEQAIARVWRLGQDKQVYVYKLLLDTDGVPNINSRNIDIITFFKKEVEEITGYKSSLELDSNTFISNESLSLYYDKKDNLEVSNIIPVAPKQHRNKYEEWSLI